MQPPADGSLHCSWLRFTGAPGEEIRTAESTQMRVLRIRAITVLALLCLALISASPIAAQGNGNGNGNGGGGGNGQNGNGNAFGQDKKDPRTVSATPELDSLVLFGG